MSDNDFHLTQAYISALERAIDSGSRSNATFYRAKIKDRKGMTTDEFNAFWNARKSSGVYKAAK